MCKIKQMYTVVNNNNKKRKKKNNIDLNKGSSLTEAQAAGLEQRLHVLRYCTVPSVGGGGHYLLQVQSVTFRGPSHFKKNKTKTVTVSTTVSENQLSISVHEKTGS